MLTTSERITNAALGEFVELPEELRAKIFRLAGSSSRLEALLSGPTQTQMTIMLLSKRFKATADAELHRGIFVFTIENARRALGIESCHHGDWQHLSNDDVGNIRETWASSLASFTDTWIFPRVHCSNDAERDAVNGAYSSILSLVASWMKQDPSVCSRLKHIICRTEKKIPSQPDPRHLQSPIYQYGFNRHLVEIVNARSAEVHAITHSVPRISGLMPDRLSVSSIKPARGMPVVKNLTWASPKSTLTWDVPAVSENLSIWERKGLANSLDVFGLALQGAEEGTQRDIVFQLSGEDKHDLLWDLLSKSPEGLGWQLGRKGYRYTLNAGDTTVYDHAELPSDAEEPLPG